MNVNRFALPPLLRAERQARALLERLLPAANEELAIPAVADDAHAWAPALARLAHTRGARVELLVDHGDITPRDLFDRLCETARRAGVILGRRPIGEVPERYARSLLQQSPRWRLVGRSEATSAPMTVSPDDFSAWDAHWPDARGEGMLHRPGPNAPVVSCAEARAIDERALRDFDLPGLVLMEHAGIGAAAVAKELLRRRGVKPGDGRYALVVGGGGNNGGDALVVARGLLEQGYEVRWTLVADPERLTPETRANRDVLTRDGIDGSSPCPASCSEALEAITRWAPGADLLVDGLLGTGAKGEPRGAVREAIRSINEAAARGVPVLSMDLPSGLDGDTGRALSATVKATATVTFAAVKRGLRKTDGPTHTGELYLADIGAPC